VDPAIDNGTNVLVRFKEVVTRTDKAVKFSTPMGVLSEFWLPKSMIAHLDEEKGEVWIPLWLAEKRGIKYE